MNDYRATREELLAEVQALRDRVRELEQAHGERQRTEEVLRSIAQGVSPATGEAFFRYLVEHLAETLRVDYALIGELTGKNKGSVQTLANYARGQLVDNCEYRLAHTPCEGVVTRQVCCYPSGVQRYFPRDPLLVEMEAESYIGTPLFDSAGRSLGLMAVLDRRPMTDPQTVEATLQIFAARAAAELERKQVEEHLRESEELNRRIIENVPAGIITFARDGSFLQVNAEALRMLESVGGRAPRPHVGDYEPITIREDGSPFLAKDYPILKCLETGKAQPPVVIGGRRPDGRITWSLLTAAPLHDSKTGQVTGAVVTFVDLTERKQAEEELRESEERLRRFFDAAFEGIAIHDNGRILDANQSLAAMFGYEMSEIIGMHACDLTVPEGRAEIMSRIASGSEGPYEAVGLRKDGSTFPGELRAREIPYHGRMVRVTAVRDLTLRKQAEEQLQEYTQDLQALSLRLLEVQEQERRHLARELHDEIGQLLTGLKLTLEMGLRLPPQELRAQLGEARELVRDLTARVRDLSLHLRPTMLDDLGLLPALLWHFERYTAQTKVRVAFEHGGLERRFQPAVETAAYRIVQEALTNVARYAGVGEVMVRIWVDQDRLGIRIEDRGVGFDSDAALTAGFSSGLSGMKERAVLLGGRLTVKSGPATGTCLTAELPIDGADERRRVCL